MIFIDTNVISETMRPKPEGTVLRWVENNGPSLHISTVVLAEILFGINKVRPSERSGRWQEIIVRWRRQLGRRIQPFDEESADVYAQFMGEAKLRGYPIDTTDGMIAAIALRHNAALATRNTAHFDIPGLKLINPWQHPT
jgi:predicted nucleic acid-binding protein